ncbi:MAG: ribose-phosphate pyrophosphokinase [Flavobacteriales bacterium]|jgi:ribose-phosphate pyrophosphokinase|nr:ribose-phosphate pyrophosphokinase [Flavobacteriales bacterium]|tara:strand:+ start:341 stop:1273 length:933 start_codon:yes stop_codon:yes gene_type:complete
MLPEAKIFAGRNTMELAKNIAGIYGIRQGDVKITEFSDGEFCPSFEETVRGNRVFLIQSTNPPADNLMELLLLCDAAKRASAKHITAVIPYFGLARQDRKDKPRVPIGAKLAAKMLMAAGATRVMTMDLHADQIQGFFEVPVDHLYSSALFIKDVETLHLENLCVASPDMGGAKRAHAYGSKLEADVVICYKERKKANVIDKMTVIGDVAGKNVVLIDDMVDTGGTLCKAAHMLKEKGAVSVRAYCTHGILSGSAHENIAKSALEELVITNSIPQTQNNPKIRVISVAEMFAQVMKNVHHHESISGHFIM